MPTNSVVLVGYFNEIHELADRAGVRITAIVDPSYGESSNQVIPCYSSDDSFLSGNGTENVFLTPDHPKIRQKLHNQYSGFGHEIISLFCPTAMISPSATIGGSCCIQSGANVSSNVIIGIGVKVNSHANVMHDCVIDDFTTIAPNAVLLGGVKVGCCSYIGANATILPGISIGSGAMVGAGSVVTKDVSDGTVVCGNPARKLR